MNKKYNKSYLLMGSILVVLIGLGIYLGIVTPNSYYTFAVTTIAFLVSIILTSLVFIREEAFGTPTKVVTVTISCLTFITVVINIFTLF